MTIIYFKNGKYIEVTENVREVTEQLEQSHIWVELNEFNRLANNSELATPPCKIRFFIEDVLKWKEILAKTTFI